MHRLVGNSSPESAFGLGLSLQGCNCIPSLQTPWAATPKAAMPWFPVEVTQGLKSSLSLVSFLLGSEALKVAWPAVFLGLVQRHVSSLTSTFLNFQNSSSSWLASSSFIEFRPGMFFRTSMIDASDLVLVLKSACMPESHLIESCSVCCTKSQLD